MATNNGTTPIISEPVVPERTAVITRTDPESGAILVQVGGETLSLAAALESLLFVADSAVEIPQLIKTFNLPAETLEQALRRLGECYQQERRGLRLLEQAGRFRLVSTPAAANLIETYLNLDLTTRLSGPALETLAVIAYRQPVTRMQIESVRGVDCGAVVRSLLQRGLIEESGRLETVGRPILYSVTEQFMQHFGLISLQELPPLENNETQLLEKVSNV